MIRLLAIALTFLLVSCVVTPTPEVSPEVTELATLAPTDTPTEIEPTWTETASATIPFTIVPPSITATILPTFVSSSTFTATATNTRSPTPTRTRTPTNTPTPTRTPTVSPTFKPATVEPTPTNEFFVDTEAELNSCINLTVARVCTVTGVIITTKRTTIANGNLWLRGQGETALITNSASNLYEIIRIVGATNVRVSNLRFRRTPNNARATTGDSFAVINSSWIYIENCSFYWGVDANLDINNSQHVWVSRSIIAEGVRNSSHAEGQHSTGTVILYSSDIHIVTNAYVSNKERSPRIGSSSTVHVLGNLIVNPGSYSSVITSDDSPTTVNYAGNRTIPGVDTPVTAPVAITGANSLMWVDNPLLVREADRVRIVSAPYAGADTLYAVADTSLDGIGAYPRDAQDARIAACINAGTCAIVDAPP